MDGFTAKDRDDALQALASMIRKTEQAKAKFTQGTSQYALLKHRLAALRIASMLVSQETAESAPADGYTQEDLENAIAPIASLISKSEKAREKLAPGTWQYTMLGNNLNALQMAAPRLAQALNGLRAGEERPV